MKELTVDFPSRVQILRAIHRIPERNHVLVRSIIQTISGDATFVAQQVRRLQAGSLHLYLLYIAIMLTPY